MEDKSKAQRSLKEYKDLFMIKQEDKGKIGSVKSYKLERKTKDFWSVS